MMIFCFLEQGLELFFENLLLSCAHKLVYQLAIFEEQDGGDVAHTEVHSDVFVLFYIAFPHNDLAVVVVGEL